MAKRADRADRRRGAPDHLPGLLADRLHLPAELLDRDDGRLEDNDALTANEHERVRRPEIDRQLAAWADCSHRRDPYRNPRTERRA